MEAGNLLVCQAGNPCISDSTLEDAWKLEIHCKDHSFYLLTKNTSRSEFFPPICSMGVIELSLSSRMIDG